MARPKLGDSESKRLQLVITEDELEAIADWQFANKVPSKSEAVRRLCQLGLLYEKRLPALIEQTLEISNELHAEALAPASVDGQDEIEAIFASLGEATAKNIEFRTRLIGEVISILAEAQILHSSNVEDSPALADQLRKKIESLGIGSEESTEYVLGVLHEMLKNQPEVDREAKGGAQ